MTGQTKESIINTLLISWLVICIILFGIMNRTSYIHFFVFPNLEIFYHKLLQISLLIYFLNIVISLMKLLGFVIICIGIGLIILSLLKVPRLSDLAFGVTAFITGEVFLSLLFLYVFTVVSLTYSLTLTILIVCLLIGIVPNFNFIKSIQFPEVTYSKNKQKAVMAVLCLSIITASLLLSSSRLGYDAVSDYFSQAKLMAVSQEMISFFPENYMIVSSLHVDILFTVLIQIAGDQSARMLSWVNGMAILLMGFSIAKEAGITRKALLYFFLLMLTSTAFIDLLGDGKVELICTAPIISVVYWMLISLKKPLKGIFLLIGLLAGFAIISRLYNIFLVILFIALFYVVIVAKKIYTKWHKNKFDLRIISRFSSSVLWMFPTLLSIGGFHLWQNWLWLDSPFAPLSFAQKLEVNNWEWQFDPAILNLLRIFYLFTITFFNNPQSLGNISPMVIGFLPFLTIKNIRSQIRVSNQAFHLIFTAISTLIIWLISFYTVVEVRYVFFIWVLLFIPIAQIIESTLGFLPKFFSSPVKFFINITLLFIAIRILVIAIATYSPIDSHKQAHCDKFSFCDFLQPVNQIAATNDRILALNAYRYYLRTDLFACSSRATEYASLKNLVEDNPTAFWIEVYRQGYSYITYEENFALYHSRFGRIPSPSFSPSWLKVTLISSSNEGKNNAYQINAVNAPFPPEIKCKKDEELGIWYLILSNNKD